MTAFDYRIPAQLFPCKSDAGLFPTTGGKRKRAPTVTGGSPTRRTPSASQSRSFHPSFFQARVWK